jgi:hypothetical protein
MGYLDNTSITVDAILTNKGRELLAQGANAFNITQFALGDDEIDYTLWNPADTRGTAFYGSVIENMPVTEAIPEQTKALRYKLLSLPGNNAQYIPKVSLTPLAPGTVNGDGGTITFNIATSNYPNANQTLGYTAILQSDAFGTLSPAAGTALQQQPAISTDPGSIAVVGTGKFDLIVGPNPSTTKTRSTTLTFFANETGGEISVDVTQAIRTALASTIVANNIATF